MSDRVVVMRQGEIEQIGTPQDVYERPATPFVAAFLGKVSVLDRRRCGQRPLSCRRVRAHAAGGRLRHRRARSHLPAPRGPPHRGNLDDLPNRLSGTVRRIEYLGTVCLAEVDCEPLGQSMLVSLSLNQLHDLGDPRRRRTSTSPCAWTACACSPTRRCNDRDRGSAGGRRRARRAGRWTNPSRPTAACGCCWRRLLVFLTLPLAMLFIKSVEDKSGAFVGLANFIAYAQTPSLATFDGQLADLRALHDAPRGAARVRLRVRDPAHVHSRQGTVAQHRAHPDPRAVDAARRCRSSTSSATRACSRACCPGSA